MLRIEEIGSERFEVEFEHQGELHRVVLTARVLPALEKIRLMHLLEQTVFDDEALKASRDADEYFASLSLKRQTAYERIASHIVSVEGVVFSGDRTWADLESSERILLMESDVWSRLFLDSMLQHYLKRDREAAEEQGK